MQFSVDVQLYIINYRVGFERPQHTHIHIYFSGCLVACVPLTYLHIYTICPFLYHVFVDAIYGTKICRQIYVYYNKWSVIKCAPQMSAINWKKNSFCL